MLQPCQGKMLARGTEDKEHAMSQKLNSVIAVIGIDIGKNSFKSGRAARWKRGLPTCSLA